MGYRPPGSALDAQAPAFSRGRRRIFHCGWAVVDFALGGALWWISGASCLFVSSGVLVVERRAVSGGGGAWAWMWSHAIATITAASSSVRLRA
jgi:hypothetical protein